MLTPLRSRRPPSIVVASSDPSRAAPAFWPVAAGWPRSGPGPSVEHLDYAGTATAVTARSLKPDLLVILPRRHEASSCVKLLHAAQAACVPIVVLEPPGMALGAVPAGAVRRGIDEPGPALAAVCEALIERQGAVDQIATELSAERSSHTGVEGQLLAVHDEMQLAAMVQREFMPAPTLAMPAGLDVGVLFRPVGYVSGDIYDFAPLDEHVVSFFLADATGHGVPAALMTLVLLHALPRVDGLGADQRFVPPGEALTRLNQAMTRRPHPGRRFATAVYGLIDLRVGKVTLAVAGHPSPLLSAPGSSPMRIDANGPLLGVFPEAEFGQITLPFAVGSSLVAYTDGLETAYGQLHGGHRDSDHRHVHEGQIRELLAGLTGGASCASVIERFEEGLSKQTGSLHPDDDVTMLAISRRAVTSGSADVPQRRAA